MPRFGITYGNTGQRTETSEAGEQAQGKGRLGQMSVAFRIDPKEVRQLEFPHAANPSRLMESARLAEKLAARVENEWESFPPEARELLAAFAYNAIREPSGVRDQLRLSWVRVKLGYTLARGREEMLTVTAYVDAMQHLIDTILLAIERDDEGYQERVAAAVERAISKQESSEV